ncbi:MAG: glycosyltransferase [Flavobacteriaceae bacterium]|jgi:glycosyltransferase involved in cell wall biosynthesis|nr:glycosyltransferase family 2 protein [Flavobacteriaceae bacterium]MDB2463298.1 glycosyltransferase family 2 protein [Flavobacteriaceae bacterium]MDC0408732.1 glycosyltransferase family 2 protein [Flavobacteriaceae bacterium]NBT86880.1 glycosyltransferase [Flavobacteriaceae bacterium]
MELSIVIPLLNEAESLSELHQWITKSLDGVIKDYELIFIDDGSQDNSWEIINLLASQDKRVKGLRFLKNFGKSQALHAGFARAQGQYVVTMDADLQDNPEEIPHLIEMLRSQGYDMVSGWKKKRYDSYFGKNLPSKLFNFAARKTSGVALNDFNCGLKAYKAEVVQAIEVTGEMHRYIPVLASNAGFKNIGERVVQHQARKFGHTKFGSERFLRGFLDLITISFISRFGKRPMHLFGAWGALMLALGFLFAAYLGIDKLILNPTGRLITERPQFYIALTAMILGGQFFIAGFLGELILRSKQSTPNYRIKESLNLE